MIKDFNVGTKTFTYESDRQHDPLVHMTVDERIKVYVAFLQMLQSGIIDKDLKEYSEYLSLRLDYEQDPIYGLEFKDGEYKPNGKTGLTSRPFEEHVQLQLVHSLLGENDDVTNYGITHGLESMWEAYMAEELPAVRTSLFQIYWSKGTVVREWAAKEIPTLLTDQALSMLNEVKEGQRDRWTIMEFAESYYSFMKENSQQKKMKYSVKDVALDFSIAFPQLVDPESFLEAGTGCKRALERIFGKLPGGKRRDPETLERYERIMMSEGYPLTRNHYSRNEALLCYHMDKSIKIKTNRIEKRKATREGK